MLHYNLQFGAANQENSPEQWRLSAESALEQLILLSKAGNCPTESDSLPNSARQLTWLHFVHERLCCSFEFVPGAGLIAIISRSRPGLRAALRAGGVAYSMPCAPDLDQAERKNAQIQQLAKKGLSLFLESDEQAKSSFCDLHFDFMCL